MITAQHYNSKHTLIAQIKEASTIADNYIKECDRDAERARKNKNRGRWASFYAGIVTATIGFVAGSAGFTKLPNEARFMIGLVNTVAGVVVTTASQRLDPVFSKERSIDLRSVKLDFETVKREVEYTLKKYEEDSQTDIDKYEQLQAHIFTNLNQYQRTAHELGVYI